MYAIRSYYAGIGSTDLAAAIATGVLWFRVPASMKFDAAKENGIYIPTLCNYPGVKPKGSCRICTVKVNGRMMTACTRITSYNVCYTKLLRLRPDNYTV